MTNRFSLLVPTFASLLAGCSQETLQDPLSSAANELLEENGITFNSLTNNSIAINSIAINSIAINSIAINSIAINGINLSVLTMNNNPLDNALYPNFQKVFKYMVQCALPAGQCVSVTDVDGSAASYCGALGVAPTWATTPLSQTDQWRVTSCLMARTNAYGYQVAISLRGEGITVDQTERTYTYDEGAFWGNIFSPNPALYACTGNYSDFYYDRGRLCSSAASACGFTIVGSCLTACAIQAKNGGPYRGCSSNTTCTKQGICSPDIEISTYLLTPPTGMGVHQPCHNQSCNGLSPENIQVSAQRLFTSVNQDLPSQADSGDAGAHRGLLRYAVRCALPIGESFRAGTQVLQGARGLAPAWRYRGLNESERQLVTGCILAHVNQFGAKVPIELDVASVGSQAPSPDMAYPDGAFFGDLATSSLYSCTLDSEGERSTFSSLRVCDEPGNRCGIQSLGRCADHCSFDNGHITSCRAPSGTAYSHVVGVRLPSVAAR